MFESLLPPFGRGYCAALREQSLWDMLRRALSCLAQDEPSGPVWCWCSTVIVMGLFPPGALSSCVGHLRCSEAR